VSGTRPNFDGRDIKLVVFDVDGTLYSQSALRLRMLPELLVLAISAQGRESLKIIVTYRRLRETYAERELEGFDTALVEETATSVGCKPEFVREVIGEWIYRQPLRHLKTCVLAGVPEFFTSLNAAGKTVGIFSDYAAEEKLEAMGLASDHIASADDPNVAMLKPNPKGLLGLMEKVGTPPKETLLIGDREERDGEAARRAGVHALIRSSKPSSDFRTFKNYADPVFATLTHKQ
jgi:putative hydrolase of the HAD superfamily